MDPQLPPSASGELIVPHGPGAGSRCPLNVPLLRIGRSTRCGLRLDEDGVDGLHCVIALSPDGPLLHDLDSGAGVSVNGVRIEQALLHDGDVIGIGPVELEVRLPAVTDRVGSRLQALRVQAAAVAAQQSALTDEETRLAQHRAALQEQEEQLATHLDRKRQRLLSLNERAQSERRALQHERAGYEKYIDRVTGDLGQTQRELVAQQEQLEAERRRVNSALAAYKKRMRRRMQAERARVARREQELAGQERELNIERAGLKKREDALVEDRLRFNADYELGRRQMYDAWQRLRRAQHAWRQRRRLERAAVKLRERELVEAEHAWNIARAALERDRQEWEFRRESLQREAAGLDQRCLNERRKLDARSKTEATSAPAEGAPNAASAAAENPSPGTALVPALPSATADAVATAARQVERLDQRARELDRLAAELADQRVELAEQWTRLVETQQRWEADQLRATVELEVLFERVADQEAQSKTRELARVGADATLQQRHKELTRLHDQLVGWRARLHAREHAWESERTGLLAEVKRREELAQAHLEALAGVRQRWSQRRRQELNDMRGQRAEYEALRHDTAVRRADVEKQAAEISDERRRLAEKALALEQFRQELVLQSGDSAKAERQIARLRRRWLTQNTAALRAALRARDSVRAELTALNERAAAVEKRSAAVAEAEAELTEKSTAWEHKQILAHTRHTRLEQELQSAQAQRFCLEVEVSKMKEEIERIARGLLSEPEPPAIVMDQAA